MPDGRRGPIIRDEELAIWTVVLVVEDEPMVLIIALDMVAEEYFEAVGAESADEAMRILESRADIEIVFTDTNMPGSIDGLGLAQAVRGRWPAIQFVVTSGLGNGGLLPKGSVFLPKPYSADQLATALDKLAA